MQRKKNGKLHHRTHTLFANFDTQRCQIQFDSWLMRLQAGKKTLETVKTLTMQSKNRTTRKGPQELALSLP